MTDEKGKDEKLLAVIEKEPYFNDTCTLKHVSDHKLTEITEFFKTYKNLEKNKWSQVDNWHNYDEAIALLKNSHNNYLA